jgi:hypothetical protein
MQNVSEGALEWYSKCYCVASVTKLLARKGVNVFVTLATQQHLEYHCRALFETPCHYQWKSH